MISTLRTTDRIQNGLRWISGRFAHLLRQRYPIPFRTSAAKGRAQTIDIVTIRSCLRHHSSGVRPEHLRASPAFPMGLYEKGLSDGSQSVPRQYHGKATVRLELARAPSTETRKEHIAMVVRVLRLSD
ncbi:hypothetical protein D9611_006705 [Ephemerocybe angulata]|uniref:Uncharacterized protein n=1 Tax=Ephemerocybe angulata TaxID=980116 RepID=A0A8H5FH91_9AGAR|nr:hypothetical protein D9611_006705 [Tulosesus angulatus]